MTGPDFLDDVAMAGVISAGVDGDMSNNTSRTRSVVIFGGGRVGLALAVILREASEYDVTIVDPTEPGRAAAYRHGFHFVDIDNVSERQLDQIVGRADAIVAATPSWVTPSLAAAARRTSTHYLDLSADTEHLTVVRREASTATSSFVPQCGVSPGLISQLVIELAAGHLQEARIDVEIGTLPRFAGNRLGYGLTWDVDALLREYTAASTALGDGKIITLPAMSDVKTLRWDDALYETFIAGDMPLSLCERMRQDVQSLRARTIRYPGHLDYMQFLLDDLQLRRRPDVLKNILLNALPEIHDDRLLLVATATGLKDGRRIERRFTRNILAAAVGGIPLGALRRTAASHVAAVLDLVFEGYFAGNGLVAQEDIQIAWLKDSRFLKWFFEDDVLLAGAPVPAGRVVERSAAAGGT